MLKIDKINLAARIDHTILKPGATDDEIVKLCREAIEYGFASVCVNPCFTKLVAEQLKGSLVKVCVVIGFPLGANMSEIKVHEAQKSIEYGAQEIDMVINIGALKSGNSTYVENEIKQVVDASKSSIVKVIIETCLLTNEEKVTACKLAQNAGAHFVKTSTGFSSGGATCEDVSLMKGIVGSTMSVKASGGIKTLQDALKMIDAGADRIGTSSGISIINEIK